MKYERGPVPYEKLSLQRDIKEKLPAVNLREEDLDHPYLISGYKGFTSFSILYWGDWHTLLKCYNKKLFEELSGVIAEHFNKKPLVTFAYYDFSEDEDTIAYSGEWVADCFKKERLRSLLSRKCSSRSPIDYQINDENSLELYVPTNRRVINDEELLSYDSPEARRKSLRIIK